jgi:hypothetical protein
VVVVLVDGAVEPTGWLAGVEVVVVGGTVAFLVAPAVVDVTPARAWRTSSYSEIGAAVGGGAGDSAAKA